jgi:predicted protein tyrosine phosphatase
VKRLLFVCGRNRRRSPTAEQIFAGEPGVEVDSAGLGPESANPLSAEQVAWADIVFVMERSQRRKLTQRFGRHLRVARIVCLDIPDRFAFMDPELVALLRRKVAPFLR